MEEPEASDPSDQAGPSGTQPDPENSDEDEDDDLDNFVDVHFDYDDDNGWAPGMKRPANGKNKICL